MLGWVEGRAMGLDTIRQRATGFVHRVRAAENEAGVLLGSPSVRVSGGATPEAVYLIVALLAEIGADPHAELLQLRAERNGWKAEGERVNYEAAHACELLHKRTVTAEQDAAECRSRHDRIINWLKLTFNTCDFYAIECEVHNLRVRATRLKRIEEGEPVPRYQPMVGGPPDPRLEQGAVQPDEEQS